MSRALTDAEARALGERLEALRLPGIEGASYWHPRSGHRIRADRPFGWVGPVPVPSGYLLDLRIAGNRGELLEVVRERLGEPTGSVVLLDGEWFFAVLVVPLAQRQRPRPERRDRRGSPRRRPRSRPTPHAVAVATRYDASMNPDVAIFDYLGENRRRVLVLLRENIRLERDAELGLIDAEMLRRRAVLLVGLAENRADDLALLRVPRSRLGRALLRVAVVLGEAARWAG